MKLTILSKHPRIEFKPGVVSKKDRAKFIRLFIDLLWNYCPATLTNELAVIFSTYHHAKMSGSPHLVKIAENFIKDEELESGD